MLVTKNPKSKRQKRQLQKTDAGWKRNWCGETDEPTKSEGTTQAWTHREWLSSETQVYTEKKVGIQTNIYTRGEIKHQTGNHKTKNPNHDNIIMASRISSTNGCFFWISSTDFFYVIFAEALKIEILDIDDSVKCRGGVPPQYGTLWH